MAWTVSTQVVPASSSATVTPGAGQAWIVRPDNAYADATYNMFWTLSARTAAPTVQTIREVIVKSGDPIGQAILAQNYGGNTVNLVIANNHTSQHTARYSYQQVETMLTPFSGSYSIPDSVETSVQPPAGKLILALGMRFGTYNRYRTAAVAGNTTANIWSDAAYPTGSDGSHDGFALPISNTTYFTVFNSGAAITAYISGFEIQSLVTERSNVVNVAAAASVDIQPPVSEVWVIRAMQNAASISFPFLFWSAEPGSVGAITPGLQWGSGRGHRMKLLISNTAYYRATNSTGNASVHGYFGFLQPA